MRKLVNDIYRMTGTMPETDLGHLATQAAEELDRIDKLFTREDVETVRKMRMFLYSMAEIFGKEGHPLTVAHCDEYDDLANRIESAVRDA